MDNDTKDQENELNSLETPDTVVENSPESVKKDDGEKKPDKPKQGFGKKIQGIVSHLNIYLLLFILILVITGVIVFVGIQNNKKAETPANIDSQPLSEEAIKQLQGSATKIGDPKQTLSIESNAIFTGKVLFRDSIDVAGTIKVGGAMSLSGLTVSGEANFDQIQANKLSVSGDVNVQGQLTVQKNLTVSGGASFGGGISAPVVSTQSLQINGDLQFSRHLDAGGGTPGKSNGNALGGGGTASISGSDTAGTVNINIGGGPSAGCFVTISFVNAFNSTPHVVVSPVGGGAGGLSYYIDRSASGFSICSVNAAAPGSSFSFDYIAIE
jgi:cytoskeletal protein CcmA (bactofilin family)